MKIQFRDFIPDSTQSQKLIFTVRTIGSFENALAKANKWIENNRVDIVNIETVLLPNMHSEEGSIDTDLKTSGEMSTNWYQFIRVWYRE